MTAFGLTWFAKAILPTYAKGKLDVTVPNRKGIAQVTLPSPAEIELQFYIQQTKLYTIQKEIHNTIFFGTIKRVQNSTRIKLRTLLSNNNQ